MAQKKRLDVLVHELGLAPSREMAQRYILAGEIMVNGELRTKPGVSVPADADVTLKKAAQFVSRGGLKLEGALQHFPVVVEGRICADVGASTGGFTDCLLQRGAAKVYAIDVGYGQLAVKLRDDARVVVMERTNARYLDNLPEPIALVVIDASFISLKMLLPTIADWLTPTADVIALIKPQFEAGKAEVDKGEGVIKDAATHRAVLLDVLSTAQEMDYTVSGLVESQITGPKGNREFLVWLQWSPAHAKTDILPLIDQIVPLPSDPEQK
ncbi:16S/23S rRNA (cytidine-2'-O)-methyltransferase TlyA [Anaerolineae bacterium]|nr:16S/23S rRNA (cytidine-2'-O)-methyltransferase TlyA [Anaerolineae bacterium]